MKVEKWGRIYIYEVIGDKVYISQIEKVKNEKGKKIKVQAKKRNVR